LRRFYTIGLIAACRLNHRCVRRAELGTLGIRVESQQLVCAEVSTRQLASILRLRQARPMPGVAEEQPPQHIGAFTEEGLLDKPGAYRTCNRKPWTCRCNEDNPSE
jgi:hypothetical protein